MTGCWPSGARCSTSAPPAAGPGWTSCWPGARTAHWLLGLPRDVAGSAPPPGADDGGLAWLTTLDSAAGPVTTVLPPCRLDDEALTWPGSLSRYGGDEAAWWPGGLSRPS